MALRKIPIRRAGNRENLFMGGDRELVMFSGVMAFALIFSAQELRATLFGLVLWFGALFAVPPDGEGRSQDALGVHAPAPLQELLPGAQHTFPREYLRARETVQMIYAITFAIAGLGAGLLFILYSRIRAVDAELKLKKHRSKDAGLADLLNYAAMVDDGVIVGKNGAFMAAWLYQGDDNASSTDADREMVSFRINQALAGLGNGWMVHVDAVRRPAPNYSDRTRSHFPDAIMCRDRRRTPPAV